MPKMATKKISRCYIIYVFLGFVHFPRKLVSLERGTAYISAVSVCPSREITPDADGHISSEGYPSDYYDKNLNCTLILKVPRSKLIRIAFSEIDIKASPNCTKDAISITNNQWSKNEARETTYCGRHFVLGGSLTTVVRTFPNRPNNTDVIVRFTTDEYGTGAGFLLRYELIDKPQLNLDSKCFSPLGMEDGRIKDSQIKVSSVKKGTTATGQQARLGNNLTTWSAWCPENDDPKEDVDEYIQINLLHLTKLTRVATQGREYNGGKEFVKNYKLSYSKDGRNWIDYGGNAIIKRTSKIFQGNTDAKSVVINDLNPPITARYIRIHPDYNKLSLVCMRLELYGCVTKNDTEATPKDPNEKNQNVKTIFTLVGVGVSLSIVLVVLLVIWRYKRRCKASKPPTPVRIALQNESTAGTPLVAQERATTVNATHRQVLESGYAIPAPAKIVPYKVIKIPSNTETFTGYTELDINTRQDSLNGTSLDVDNYQKLLKRESGYVIPAERNSYENVPSITLSGYKDFNDHTRQGNLKDATTASSNQNLLKRESGYVIPAQGDGEVPYEEVQTTTPSGYTELDKKTREEDATNGAYQKLLKHDQAYVIPSNGNPTPNELRIPEPTSGYTELDFSKRQPDNNDFYQKLIRNKKGLKTLEQ